MKTSEINKHHTIFERSAYRRHPVYRALRETHGLIIPLHVTDHRALHSALDSKPDCARQPSVPYPDIEAARHFTETIALPPTPEDPLLTLRQAIGWFAMTNNEPTAEHLHLQHEFIRHTSSLYIGVDHV